MATAPSIYEYRSRAEWEQAMREWCEENEPRYFATLWDGQKWVRVEAEGYDHAVRLCTEHDAKLRNPDGFNSHLSYTSCMIAGRWCDGPLPRIPEPAPCRGASVNHLDGGSRDDYRAAGFRRY